MTPQRIIETAAKKVMVVDDEPGICDVLFLNLEAEGYEMICAMGGREAIETLKTRKPDLILLDIMMPEIDGWEVLSHIKQDPSLSDIPVILLSAKNEEISKLLGFQLGAVDYVTKPFSIKELMARIGVVLSRQEEQPAASPPRPRALDERISAYKDGELYFLDPEDILFIAADRNNSYFHTDGDRFVLHRNLSYVEQRLPEFFLRVHKSYIVNLNKVSKLASPSRGAYTVELTDADKSIVPVSRGKVSVLRQLSSAPPVS